MLLPILTTFEDFSTSYIEGIPEETQPPLTFFEDNNQCFLWECSND